MILPWKVDVPQDRLPFVNWLLIASIIAVFLWEMPQLQTYDKAIQEKQMEILLKQNYPKKQIDPNYRDPNYIESEFRKIENPLKEYMLTGLAGKGLITHMWLHGDWMHLIGNMLFLWIFGNAVCAKLGNITYLPVYLIVGLWAAITYLFFSNQPMLGASGAINGIVGMYLVFFPTNSITCYWSFTILYWKQFESPSYAIILLWLAYDIFGAAIGGSNIAYFAHLGGFASGLVIAIVLLKTKLIKMTDYEKSILDLIADARSVPARKERPAEVVERLYPVYKKPDAEETPGPVVQQAPQVLSEDDFFNQSASKDQQPPMQLKKESNDGFIRFTCSCGKRYKLADKYAGKMARCSQCKRQIKIPDA